MHGAPCGKRQRRLSKRKHKEKGMGEDLKRREGIYAMRRFPKKKKKTQRTSIIT